MSRSFLLGQTNVGVNTRNNVPPTILASMRTKMTKLYVCCYTILTLKIVHV
jgi:hypothetical protein